MKASNATTIVLASAVGWMVFGQTETGQDPSVAHGAEESEANWLIVPEEAVARRGIAQGIEYAVADAEWDVLSDPTTVANWSVLGGPSKFTFNAVPPATEPDPVIKPVPKPAAKPASEPIEEPAAEPTTEPVVRPARLPILYTTPYCVYCPPTKRALDAAGFRYQLVDASNLPGVGSVPAMDINGRRVVGKNAILRAAGVLKASPQASPQAETQACPQAEAQTKPAESMMRPSRRRGFLGGLFRGKRN